MSTPKHSLTLIGIGNIGSPVAQSLTKASYAVTIWNRTANRPFVAAAVSAGATFEPSLEAAVAKNDILVTCLLDYTTVRAVLSSLPPSALAGKTLINLANGRPKEATTMDTWTRQLGVTTYLDGAVMVTPEMVGGPLSFLVVSGESAEVFSGLEDIISPAGKVVYLGAKVDAAARYDVAVLAAMYGMLSGNYLAMALLKKGGSNIKLAPTVSGSLVPFLTALVPLCGREAKSWDEERFDDAAGNSLGMQYLGVKNIVESARDDGIDAGALEHLLSIMEKAIGERGGEGGTSVLGTYLFQ